MITIYLKQYNKIIRNADTGLFEELGYDDILWIDMLQPTIKEQKAVENFMEINLQTKQQVEEIESTSKYSETENAIISNANFFVPTGESFVIEPVSFIISNEGVLVSVRQAESRTFQETEKRLQINYRNYPTGYHIFITLLEVRIDYDADMVELIARQVSSLSRNINGEDSIDKEVLRRINTLQESTMLLRENIFDRQRVLSGILRSERFPNDIYPRLQLMIKDVNSLINHADFSFQRLDYIQDAALGLINIEQNEIVKIFSVAAVAFMTATLIASIYGMNFSIMPELHWKYGYLFAIGLMLLCSGLTIWFFRFKKWLKRQSASTSASFSSVGVFFTFSESRSRNRGEIKYGYDKTNSRSTADRLFYNYPNLCCRLLQRRIDLRRAGYRGGLDRAIRSGELHRKSMHFARIVGNRRKIKYKRVNRQGGKSVFDHPQIVGLQSRQRFVV